MSQEPIRLPGEERYKADRVNQQYVKTQLLAPSAAQEPPKLEASRIIPLEQYDALKQLLKVHTNFYFRELQGNTAWRSFAIMDCGTEIPYQGKWKNVPPPGKPIATVEFKYHNEYPIKPGCKRDDVKIIRPVGGRIDNIVRALESARQAVKSPQAGQVQQSPSLQEEPPVRLYLYTNTITGLILSELRHQDPHAHIPQEPGNEWHIVNPERQVQGKPEVLATIKPDNQYKDDYHSHIEFPSGGTVHQAIVRIKANIKAAEAAEEQKIDAMAARSDIKKSFARLSPSDALAPVEMSRAELADCNALLSRASGGGKKSVHIDQKNGIDIVYNSPNGPVILATITGKRADPSGEAILTIAPSHATISNGVSFLAASKITAPQGHSGGGPNYSDPRTPHHHEPKPLSPEEAAFHTTPSANTPKIDKFQPGKGKNGSR